MKFTRHTIKYSLLVTGFLITLGTFLVIALGLAYLSIGVDAATVEKYLSEQIKRPVQIESIETRWRGLHAEVEANGIRILSQDGTRLALRLRKLEISFDPLTLLGSAPGLERIVVYGLSLQALRREDGTIRIGDFVADPKRSPHPALEWFLSQRSSEIRGASLTWLDKREANRSFTFEDINIAVNNTGYTTRFSGWTVPPKALGESASVSGEIQGQPLRSGLWDGQIEVDVARLQLAELPLILRQTLPWETAGLISTRIDTEWLDGSIIEAGGDLDMSDFEIPFEGGEKIIPVNSFRSSISWRHNQKNWRLEFVNPEFNVNGSILGAGRFAVGRTHQTRTYHVDALDITQVIGVRDQLQFELPWHEVTAHIKPDGRLDAVSVVTRGPFLSPDHWRVETGFDGVGWKPFLGIPGVTGAKGGMVLEPAGGTVRLDSSGVKLDMPGILAESIYFNKFRGEVGWARDSTQWNVAVNNLELSNSDVQALRGRAKLRFPLDGSRLPHIDSEFTIVELEVDKLKRYLPLERMPPKAAEWLDMGLIQGSFRDARIDLVGDLGRFPFRNGGGSFYVSSKVLDARLHYADRWPDADKIYGDVSLNNAALHADIASAEISASRIISAVVESNDLFKRGTVLDIRANLASPASDVVEFLTEGPLVRNADPLPLQAAGSGNLELDIHLPLKDLKNGVEVSGRYKVKNAELTVVDRFSFQDLQGVIDFTDSTVEASGVSGFFLGGPVILDIDTVEAGKPPVWRIRARGRLDSAKLAAMLESGAVSASVSGTTNWDGALTVEGGVAQLEIESNLEGVQIVLPDPMEKSHAAARETKFKAWLERDKQEYRFESGPVRGLLVFGKEDSLPVIQNGVVTVGTSDTRLPPQEGIRIEIQQPFLNLDQWLALLEVDETDTPGQRGSFQSALRIVELQLEDVRFLSRNLGATSVRAVSSEGVKWRAWLYGESVTGRVDALLISDGPGDYIMDFDRLYLPKPRGKRNTSEPDVRRRYPNVEIQADHFIFGEWDLGRLDLKATGHADRWSVDDLILDQSGLQIRANGHWDFGENGSTTRIRATMLSEDVAIALEKLSLPPHIAESRVNLDIELEWPGDPRNFVLRELNGTYSAVAESGRFLNVDPGSGRLLGLFNVDAISRRLSLDFSDIFSKGLAFDQIKAEGTITGGNLYSDGMFIAGPSALIEISGRTGLAAEDYDLRVVVAPHVGSQISMISAIANPVAGAMVFIAQKVFEKQLSKMIQYQYDITGSWESPEFTTVRWEPELVEETTR